ncbi:trypsin-like peptidase domain-containing protein [Planctomicrobium sp. SH661]|uniref:trypsin-like peptidase domain-containing protein n=1 Tax=Planctomicrobium sp. SH661 TaxID=3448124 RepID=UPI003F5CBA15
MNRLLRGAFALSLLFLLGPHAWGLEPDRVVVMVDGCSGVCVDSSGLVLTAKHCDLPPMVTIRFKDRTARATRIYTCPETEGPVVYDCEGEGYPFLPVAATPPRVGERVWSCGYPHLNGRRELRWASGPVLRWSVFEYAGGAFNGNVIGFMTAPGWSGGPLLNAKGEVCGLLNSSDRSTSVFISSAAVRQASVATRPRGESTPPAIADGRPKLYVFGSMSCGPCRKFKQNFSENADLRRILEAAFTVEFVDADQQTDLAQRFNISEVPTFLVPGRDRIIGYENGEMLLIALGLRSEIAARPPPDRDGAPDPVDPQPPQPDRVPEPTIPVEPSVAEPPLMESPAPSVPVEPSLIASPNVADHLDRLSGLVQSGISIATWLGIGGMTGGAGGLVLGGVALWRTISKRRRSRAARDPPEPRVPPPVVTVESPPPPQAIVRENQFVPYERDTYAEAFAWASAELARKYPGSVSTLETLRGLIDQYLAARGLTGRSSSGT